LTFEQAYEALIKKVRDLGLEPKEPGPEKSDPEESDLVL
jgi:hypothetical protein